MTDLRADLRSAFEGRGYEVAEVSRNRSRYRVELLERDASAADLRAAAFDALGESSVVGFDVSTESDDATDVRTVVSVRYRG